MFTGRGRGAKWTPSSYDTHLHESRRKERTCTVVSTVCTSSPVALAGLVALAAAAIVSPASAQDFVAPPNSFALDTEGTLEGYRPGYLQIRDSKTETWLLSIDPTTKVSVLGQAEQDYLRPGMTVEFETEIDKKGQIAKPIEEVEIITSEGKPRLGLFSTDEDADDGRPVRTVAAGPYRVRAKLASFKGGELTVAVGSKRLTATLSEKAAIKFACNDPGMAEIGDTVKIKAWYYDNGKPVAAVGRAGKALAEEITITLTKPLAATGKKSRR